jgi:hypothetical protein
MNSTIAIDFDGVIHKYSKGWLDGSIYDEPNEGCFEALQELFNLGYELVIYTCRANDPVGAEQMAVWMQEQMKKTNTAFNFSYTAYKPVAKCYIDDRAIRFLNWRDTLNYF